jgi:hypothetical protein
VTVSFGSSSDVARLAQEYVELVHNKGVPSWQVHVRWEREGQDDNPPAVG